VQKNSGPFFTFRFYHALFSSLAVGLGCVGFINLTGGVAGVQRKNSFIYWTQVIEFHLKMET
jgi:hypothetical protein